MLLRTGFAYTRTRRYMQPAFVLKDVTCPRARTCAAIAVPRPTFTPRSGSTPAHAAGTSHSVNNNKDGSDNHDGSDCNNRDRRHYTVRACCCATKRKDMLSIKASEGRWE